MENITVLIINDSIQKTRDLRESLAVFGVKNVKVVKSYTEALELLKKQNYTLVIVELFIENASITGIEFILKLRQDIENFVHVQDIPVIITAGGVTKQEVESARDAGVTEFIIYPYSVSYLQKVVTSTIEKPRKFVISQHYLGPDRRRKRANIPEGKDRRSDEDTK